MNDIARQLRAQIPSSTDPDRLERMAREIEAGSLPAGAPDRRSRGCKTPRDLPKPAQRADDRGQNLRAVRRTGPQTLIPSCGRVGP